MRLMLEKKDLVIEELRSRLNRTVVADDGANVSCDQVRHDKFNQQMWLMYLANDNYSTISREHSLTS